MLFALSLLAALACAFCYGISSVLQKSGADKQKKATSLSPGLLFRLAHNLPYAVGTFLDAAVWPLTIFAVKNLPLFVVQPIISLSVVITVIAERVAFGRKLPLKTIGAIGLVLIGLVIIAMQAGLQSARPLSKTALLSVTLVGPLAVLFVGGLCLKLKHQWSSIGLALCAGSAFGMDAVCGRILTIMHPLWRSLYQPALIATVAYGIIAVLLFTIALQRTSASTVNAIVVGVETVLPTVIGIWLLGDTPRHGSYVLLSMGIALTIVGTLGIALVRPARESRARRAHHTNAN